MARPSPEGNDDPAKVIQAETSFGGRWRFQVDSTANRGAAGVLADWNRATSDSPATEWVLVVDASASPAIRLGSLFDVAHESVAGVVGASDLGRYCGCLLIRREWLEVIPRVGFVDLREQFLGTVIERGGRVRCASVATRALRLNTRESWLKSVAAWERLVGRVDPKPETWAGYQRHGDCAVQRGALVAGSRIVSSVVLDNAIVEPGACVARSIICPGAVVRSGEVMVDCVVGN